MACGAPPESPLVARVVTRVVTGVVATPVAAAVADLPPPPTFMNFGAIWGARTVARSGFG